ncbi:MAG: hypothetical protein II329_04685, partial [Clostridia bacterium]|nr:hypothetical protein [Clostridia bacterium]
MSKNDMMNKNEKNTRKDDVLEKLSFGADTPSAPHSDGHDTSLGFDTSDDKRSAKKDDKAQVKEVVKKKVRYDRGSGVRSLLFTLGYLVTVLVLAVVLAHYVITRANDAFAFVKEDITVEVTVEDKNMSLDALADLLHEKGAISYPGFFKLYVQLKNDGKFTLKEGTHTFSSNSNYDVILANLN